MNPDIFSNDEKMAMKECVEAFKLLPFYISDDFEDNTGVDHEDVNSVLKNFPNWDLYDEGTSGYDASYDVMALAFFYFSSGNQEERDLMRKHISFSESFISDVNKKFNSFSSLDPNSVHLIL
jgi:hypothetical protein